jgi:hypothetical protein
MLRKISIIAGALVGAAVVAVLLVYASSVESEIRPLCFSLLKGRFVVVEGEEAEIVMKGLDKLTKYADLVIVNVYGMVDPVIEVRLVNGSMLLAKAERMLLPLRDDMTVALLRVRGQPRRAGEQVVIMLEVVQGRSRTARPLEVPVVSKDHWPTLEVLSIALAVAVLALAIAVAYIVRKIIKKKVEEV